MRVHVHIYLGDSSWEENKHPRGEAGQFGSGKLSGRERNAAIAQQKRQREAEAGYSLKRVSDPLDGSHVVVTHADGHTDRIVKLTSGESMGLPGWHDMDAPGTSSFLADSQEEAIKMLLARRKGAA